MGGRLGRRRVDCLFKGKAGQLSKIRLDVSFQIERINERLHPLIKGLHEIMRSRLSKFTASGLIIGARDYYPKVILLLVL